MGAGSATLCRMASKEGWKLAYEVVSSEVARRGLSLAVFSTSVGLHRTTLDRMRKGDELGVASRKAIEGGLSLPRDFLLYIAEGDAGSVQAAGDHPDVDPDLVRWISRKLSELAQRESVRDQGA